MGENKLPTDGFVWVSDVDSKFNPVTKILSLDDEADIGYVFEVDLEVPEHLHDLFSDYPLAPTVETIQPEWLSPYQQELLRDTGFAADRKLAPNLMKKERYVVHYRNLKFYMEMGLVVTKIHRVVQFFQSYWMSPYIRKNTALRSKATSTFESDFFKLANNCVYGKCLEQIRKRVDVRIAHEGTARLNKLISRPNFKTRKIFDGGVAALHMAKTNVKLDKPIYVGMAVLELSKLHMFKFFYKMKQQYNCKLLYTDTDSLLMQVNVNDLEKDFYGRNLDLFDTSNFPKDHPLYSTENKAVVGKFKSETGDKTIAEFVGLRSKMYSIKVSDNTTIKKQKESANALPRTNLDMTCTLSV
jgi:hypothetical protein